MKIALLGFGWLAQNFLNFLEEENEKHEVIITKRQSFQLSPHQYQNLSVTPSQLCIEENGITGDKFLLKGIDKVICFFPPTSAYSVVIENLVKIVEPRSELILMSSTGVFPSHGEFDEHSSIEPSNPRSRRIYDAEQIILKRENSIVLRSGGQIGPLRLPALSLAKKPDYSIEDSPVNIVHRDDLARILQFLLKTKISEKIIHAVSPHHPLKSTFYGKQASEQGVRLPLMKKSNQRKIINSSVLEKYNYKWINPQCS